MTHTYTLFVDGEALHVNKDLSSLQLLAKVYRGKHELKIRLPSAGREGVREAFLMYDRARDAWVEEV